MLQTDPSSQKPPARWPEVLADVLAALLEIIALAALTCCYDAVVAVVAFVSLFLTEARRSKSPSLEGSVLVLLVGAVLGGLLALSFAAKKQYWRALGVVLGLIPLVWFALSL